MANHVFEGRVGLVVEPFGRHSADRMSDDRTTRSGDLELSRHLLGEGGEGVGGDDEGGNSAGFEQFRVMETPRRAAPSIRGACENQVSLPGETIEKVGFTGGRRAALSMNADELGTTSRGESLRHMA